MLRRYNIFCDRWFSFVLLTDITLLKRGRSELKMACARRYTPSAKRGKSNCAMFLLYNKEDARRCAAKERRSVPGEKTGVKDSQRARLSHLMGHRTKAHRRFEAAHSPVSSPVAEQAKTAQSTGMRTAFQAATTAAPVGERSEAIKLYPSVHRRCASVPKANARVSRPNGHSSFAHRPSPP